MSSAPSPITLTQLNQAYTKLIKMVLNRTFTTNNQKIYSFYRDPTPQQAYAILQSIFSQSTENNQLSIDHQTQLHGQKQINIPKTALEQRQSAEKVYNNITNKIINKPQLQPQQYQQKSLSIAKSEQLKEPILNQQQTHSKIDKIKRITFRISSVFRENHQKITKSQSFPKSQKENKQICSNNSLKPLQITNIH